MLGEFGGVFAAGVIVGLGVAGDIVSDSIARAFGW